MSGSIGPVNTGNPRNGECLYCWDENHARDTGYYFEPSQRMVGPVCGHRLHRIKHSWPQFKANKFKDRIRAERPERYGPDGNYWARRALLPDYCGEPGELCPGAANDRLREGREAF